MFAKFAASIDWTSSRRLHLTIGSRPDARSAAPAHVKSIGPDGKLHRRERALLPEALRNVGYATGFFASGILNAQAQYANLGIKPIKRGPGLLWRGWGG